MMVVSWSACYLVANVVAALAVALTGYGDVASASQPVWVLVVAACALWVPFMVMLSTASVRVGSGRFRDDFMVRWRPVDLLGIPVGVLSQLVVVGLVNGVLRDLFPSTFDADRIAERARDLYERAEGAWLVALVAVVVIGAPIVEELVYRGFVQNTLRARFADALALVITAAWFTVIHLRPVEFPGLFAFSLILGVTFHVTKRLGMPILAHMAFNATGLALVA
jgi:uncharacterized protein